MWLGNSEHLPPGYKESRLPFKARSACAASFLVTRYHAHNNRMAIFNKEYNLQGHHSMYLPPCSLFILACWYEQKHSKWSLLNTPTGFHFFSSSALCTNKIIALSPFVYHLNPFSLASFEGNYVKWIRSRHCDFTNKCLVQAFFFCVNGFMCGLHGSLGLAQKQPTLVSLMLENTLKRRKEVNTPGREKKPAGSHSSARL